VTDTWQDAAAGAVSPSAADAELALIALGYKQVDARKAVRKVMDTTDLHPGIAKAINAFCKIPRLY
jgi:Holliday junction resolvasome RuvABC DNA-binding subunit